MNANVKCAETAFDLFQTSAVRSNLGSINFIMVALNSIAPPLSMETFLRLWLPPIREFLHVGACEVAISISLGCSGSGSSGFKA